jgi:hypothetical protein
MRKTDQNKIWISRALGQPFKHRDWKLYVFRSIEIFLLFWVSSRLRAVYFKPIYVVQLILVNSCCAAQHIKRITGATEEFYPYIRVKCIHGYLYMYTDIPQTWANAVWKDVLLMADFRTPPEHVPPNHTWMKTGNWEQPGSILKKPLVT